MRGAMNGCTLLATLALVAACAPYGAGSSGAAGGAVVPLEGTTWTLVEVGGQPARPAGTSGAPSMRFDAAETRAGGNTGCNSFGGSYALSGGSLRFGALVSTRRACVDEALNAQEAAFLGALDATRSWRIDGSTLVLGGETGPVARFTAQ